jgi:dolichyl-phosphate-mannose--protein O-mannosyl transferase
MDFLPKGPYYVYPFLKFGFSLEQLLRTANIIFSLGNVVLIYLLGKAIFNSVNIALSAALLLSVNPRMLDVSVSCTLEPAYLFFSGFSAYCAVLFFKHKKYYWVLFAGILLGCATMIRHESFECFILFNIAFLYALYCKKFKFRDIIPVNFLLLAGTLSGQLIYFYVFQIPASPKYVYMAFWRAFKEILFG